MLMMLRFAEELVDADEYKLPHGNAAEYRVNGKELEMAAKLIESMADEWQPEKFKDEFRERLTAVIEDRLKSKGLVAVDDGKGGEEEVATTNVVDFMTLLQKSLATKKRTPAAAARQRCRRGAAAARDRACTGEEGGEEGRREASRKGGGEGARQGRPAQGRAPLGLRPRRDRPMERSGADEPIARAVEVGNLSGRRKVVDPSRVSGGLRARSRGGQVDWRARALALPGAVAASWPRRSAPSWPRCARRRRPATTGCTRSSGTATGWWRNCAAASCACARAMAWTGQTGFPALARALAVLGVDAVIDGELVALDARGRSDFPRLQRAIKARETDALRLLAFDLPGLAGVDLRECTLVGAQGPAPGVACEQADAGAAFQPPHRGQWPACVRHQQEAGRGGHRQQARGCALRAVAQRQLGEGEARGQRRVRDRGLHRAAWRAQPLRGAADGAQRPREAALRRARRHRLRRRDPARTAGAHGAAAPGRTGGRDPAARHHPPTQRALGPPAPGGRGGVPWLGHRGPAAPGRVQAPARGQVRRGLCPVPPRRHESVTPAADGSASARKAARKRAPAAADAPRITHPERVVYASGVTKGDVAAYYTAVAARMLPEVANRPLSLIRCPDGTEGACFFQKHWTPMLGKGVGTIKLRQKDGVEDYLYVRDLRGLLALVQMNSIEFHPWGSRIDKPELPDGWCSTSIRMPACRSRGSSPRRGRCARGCAPGARELRAQHRRQGPARGGADRPRAVLGGRQGLQRGLRRRDGARRARHLRGDDEQGQAGGAHLRGLAAERARRHGGDLVVAPRAPGRAGGHAPALGGTGKLAGGNAFDIRSAATAPGDCAPTPGPASTRCGKSSRAPRDRGAAPPRSGRALPSDARAGR
jgi:hypothetical protein